MCLSCTCPVPMFGFFPPLTLRNSLAPCCFDNLRRRGSVWHPASEAHTSGEGWCMLCPTGGRPQTEVRPHDHTPPPRWPRQTCLSGPHPGYFPYLSYASGRYCPGAAVALSSLSLISSCCTVNYDHPVAVCRHSHPLSRSLLKVWPHLSLSNTHARAHAHTTTLCILSLKHTHCLKNHAASINAHIGVSSHPLLPP